MLRDAIAVPLDTTRRRRKYSDRGKEASDERALEVHHSTTLDADGLHRRPSDQAPGP